MMYQLAGIPARATVLELHLTEQPQVLDEEWPADRMVGCRLTDTDRKTGELPAGGNRIARWEASYRQALPFPPGVFDLVILHHTLDDLAALLAPRSAVSIAEEWLRGVFEILKPNGVVAGCGGNRTSPACWPRLSLADAQHASRPAALSVLSCADLLARAGYCDAQVFNLLASASEPRLLVSVDANASRSVYRRALESSRDSLSPPAFWAKRAVVELGLHRLLARTLFFWGYKPC